MDDFNNALGFLMLMMTACFAVLVLRFVLPVVAIIVWTLIVTVGITVWAAVEIVLVPFIWLGKWFRRRRQKWPTPQPRPLFQFGPHFYGSRKIGSPLVVKRPVRFSVYQERTEKYGQPEPDALWDGELRQC